MSETTSDKKEEHSFWFAVAALALAMAAVVFSYLSWGYCLSTLWQWVAIPKGLPAIGMIEFAVAVLIVRNLPKTASDNDDDKSLKQQAKDAAWAVCKPWALLVSGWLIIWVAS